MSEDASLTKQECIDDLRVAASQAEMIANDCKKIIPALIGKQGPGEAQFRRLYAGMGQAQSQIAVLSLMLAEILEGKIKL